MKLRSPVLACRYRQGSLPCQFSPIWSWYSWSISYLFHCPSIHFLSSTHNLLHSIPLRCYTLFTRLTQSVISVHFSFANKVWFIWTIFTTCRFNSTLVAVVHILLKGIHWSRFFCLLRVYFKSRQPIQEFILRWLNSRRETVASQKGKSQMGTRILLTMLLHNLSYPNLNPPLPHHQ